VFAYKRSTLEWEKAGDAELDVKVVCWRISIGCIENLCKSTEKLKSDSGARQGIESSWKGSDVLEPGMLDLI
jgi:hypothetical protein